MTDRKFAGHYHKHESIHLWCAAVVHDLDHTDGAIALSIHQSIHLQQKVGPADESCIPSLTGGASARLPQTFRQIADWAYT